MEISYWNRPEINRSHGLDGRDWRTDKVAQKTIGKSEVTLNKNDEHYSRLDWSAVTIVPNKLHKWNLDQD